MKGVQKKLSDGFAAYLTACRAEQLNLSTIPPGRFLMPGDLKNAPALTFSPLALDGEIKQGTLAALMKQRYDAYISQIVRPFYRAHFTRLDRQIVVIDVLSCLTAGQEALLDLEHALQNILASFNPGAHHWLTSIWSKRIDRLVFAATKADLLHHRDHDRLQNILERLLRRAIKNSRFQGADVKVMALAALRATKEGEKKQGADTIPLIVGTPIAGEKIDQQIFDGVKKIAFYPGTLPENPEHVFSSHHGIGDDLKKLQFIRFLHTKATR